MRRISGLVMFFLLFAVYGFSQTVTIVELKGSVQVRSEDAQSWKNAHAGAVLEKNTQLQTKSNSGCTLAFDSARKNIFTVKEDSRIKLDSIIPAELVLSEGKVFSLIKAVSAIEKFEVRTPTAIAGVRGSGLGVALKQGVTSVLCFEDKIFVQGLDEKGNVTAEQELEEGFGINVGAQGAFGERFSLSSQDYKDWEGFSGAIERERQQAEKGQIPDVDTLDADTSIREEVREEERESSQDSFQEETRREEEPSSGSGKSGDSGFSGPGTSPF